MHEAGFLEVGSSGIRQPNYTLADTGFARLGCISAEERAALAQVPVVPHRVPAGGELIRYGSSPDHLYLLSDGWAYRHISVGAGTRRMPTVFLPGAICNLDNLLLARADFGVRAATDATVLALPRERAAALAAEYPGVGRAFTLLAIADNSLLTRWAGVLGSRKSAARVAYLLCELSIRARASVSDEGSSRFAMPLTHTVMGDMLGLTAIHVNRTFRSLRDDGIVATAEGMVTILDVGRLRALAGFDPDYLHQIESSCASPPLSRPGPTSPLPTQGAQPEKGVSAHPPLADPATEPRVIAGDHELLLRETHHRGSNDLQLVIGLLELQSRRAASDQARFALDDAVQRVVVLARARDSLNHERQPSIEAALRQVCEALQAQIGPRSILISTHLECASPGLSPTETTTLALVVNELATNAIKHAFDEDSPGHIQIRVRMNTANVLAVTVDDNGRPFSDATRPAGVGLGLSKRLMASIGGLFIPPAADSKTFELRVPVNTG